MRPPALRRFSSSDEKHDRKESHRKEPGGIRGVRAQWIGERSRHGTERCLVKDDIDAFACAPAYCRIHDIAFDERVTPPLPRSYSRPDFIEVAAKSGCEVIDTHHLLAEVE